MTRLENKCIEDCSNCELLKDGKVDMIPCLLDQMFQKTKKLEKKISELKDTIEAMTQPGQPPTVASIESEN